MRLFFNNVQTHWLANSMLLFMSYLFFMKGMGYKELYDLSIILLISFGICLQRKNKRYIFPLLAIFLYSILFPSVTRLWGYSALLFFFISLSSFPNIMLCLIFWMLELCDVTIDNYLLITIVFIFGYLLHYFLRINQNIIICILLSILITFTLVDLPVFKESTYVEDAYNSVYSPSRTFQRVTDSHYSKSINPNSKIIRETSFYTKISDTQPGILVFDIDYKGNNSHVSHNEWQQPTSWYSNQFLGNQYLLEALRCDGALWSNKGISMNRSWRGGLLSFPLSFSKSQPLIVRYDNTIYLHDSDYFSSYLCNYQRGLTQELVGNTARPNTVRILNVLFATLLLLLFHSSRTKYLCSVVIMCIFAVSYFLFLYPKEGDLRLIGTICNSHENIKFDGVPKKIILAGYDYIIGDKNAKILVVKKGKHAVVHNEKIVVAEDNSVIDYNGKKYEVLDAPIGNKDGIIDARKWIIDDKVYDAKIKVDDIIFIATGSPALQSWKDILK